MTTKLTKIALVALLLLAALAAPAAAEKTVERGDRGPTVRKLQRLLDVRADGVFGKTTVRALKRFQRRRDMRADGIAGPATWRALKRTRRTTRSSRSATRVASRGGSVRILQRRLRVRVDGVFGPGTARAVKRFQRRRGLTADGVVGPATWRALGIRGRRPVLERRSSGTRRGGSRRGGLPLRVRRAIHAGDRIAFKPYRLGGGHARFPDDSAYDCSGSISYVLHFARALRSGPLDSGSFMSYGRPGRGRWITIYANRGHAFMVINGRRFDTSMRGAAARAGPRACARRRATSSATRRACSPCDEFGDRASS
jgi:peptidoglycan hydrolase-like protein with peptidoglycan-binding domain